MSADYLKDLVEQNKHLRISNKSISKVIKTGDEFSEGAYTLLNTFQDPHIGLELPFIGLSEAGEKQKLIGSLPEPRHPSFIEEREKIRRQQDSQNS